MTVLGALPRDSTPASCRLCHSPLFSCSGTLVPVSLFLSVAAAALCRATLSGVA